MTKRNALREADARAQLHEVRAHLAPAPNRRQRPALDREARRLGWHSTPKKGAAR